MSTSPSTLKYCRIITTNIAMCTPHSSHDTVILTLHPPFNETDNNKIKRQTFILKLFLIICFITLSFYKLNTYQYNIMIHSMNKKQFNDRFHKILRMHDTSSLHALTQAVTTSQETFSDSLVFGPLQPNQTTLNSSAQMLDITTFTSMTMLEMPTPPMLDVPARLSPTPDFPAHLAHIICSNSPPLWTLDCITSGPSNPHDPGPSATVDSKLLQLNLMLDVPAQTMLEVLADSFNIIRSINRLL